MIKDNSYLNLLVASFPGIRANIIRWETLGYFSIPFLQEENGEPVFHVGFLEYPIFIEGRQCKAGTLHAVCTTS